MHNVNEKQVGGTHYAGTTQHWDYVRLALHGDYLMGNVTKYVARHRKKNGLQDLQKARHYLEKITDLYLSNQIAPATGRSAPLLVNEFIRSAELNFWEGRIMVLAWLWRDLNDLNEIREHISILEEHAKAAGEEPCAGYVDQDRGAGLAYIVVENDDVSGMAVDNGGVPLQPVDELEQFVLWLSVQSPAIVFGSSIETPAQMDVVKRYRNLLRDLPLQPNRRLNVKTSISYEELRAAAVAHATRCAAAKPESYYSEPFTPHEWVVDAIIAAWRDPNSLNFKENKSNLNGS